MKSFFYTTVTFLLLITAVPAEAYIIPDDSGFRVRSRHGEYLDRDGWPSWIGDGSGNPTTRRLLRQSTRRPALSTGGGLNGCTHPEWPDWIGCK